MNIEKHKLYSLKEVCDMGILGTKDRGTCNRKITDDMLGENILKTQMQGKGNAKRYYILGKHIIKYLKKIQ